MIGNVWSSSNHLLSGLAFATHGSFADPDGFARALIAEGIVSETPTTQALIAQLQTFAKPSTDESADAEVTTQRVALRNLLRRDTSTLLSLIGEVDPIWLEPTSVERSIDRLRESVSDFGLEAEFAELAVVDAFTSSLGPQDLAAMRYEYADQVRAGFNPGVELRRTELRPFYSTVLLAHDLVHVITGRVERDLPARGLEEGIADIIAHLLVSQFLPETVSEAVLWNSRLRYGREQPRRLARDALISASLAYLLVGDNGYRELVRRASSEGRHVIQEFEAKLATGSLSDQRPSPSGYRARAFVMRFLAATPDLVVSPLAFLLAEHATPGQPIEGLLERFNVVPDEGRLALQELQVRVPVLLVTDGRISANVSGFYKELGHFRYEPMAPGGNRGPLVDLPTFVSTTTMCNIAIHIAATL